MKPFTTFCVMLAIVVGAQLISIHTNGNDSNGYKPEADEVFSDADYDENKPISGMNFSTEYVMAEYEYDNMYCLVYDDADANMFESVIFVDADTYQSVIEAIKSGTEMCGSLETNNSLTTDSVEVFTFVSDSIH